MTPFLGGIHVGRKARYREIEYGSTVGSLFAFLNIPIYLIPWGPFPLWMYGIAFLTSVELGMLGAATAQRMRRRQGLAIENGL